MVERRLAGDQRGHHLGMAQVRRGDQCGALVGAGDGGVLPPEANGELQHLQVVEDRGDGDDVVGLVVQER